MDVFLGTCILEEDRWVLLYLTLALDCDMPILEAYWHICDKLTCLRWDEKTQSFHNRDFLRLLQETAQQRLVTDLPGWQQLQQGGAWGFFRPMNQNQAFFQWFELSVREEENLMTMSIAIRKEFFDQPTMHEIETSFIVKWEITNPLFAISINTGEWRTVEAGTFPLLFEAELRRLVAAVQ